MALDAHGDVHEADCMLGCGAITGWLHVDCSRIQSVLHSMGLKPGSLEIWVLLAGSGGVVSKAFNVPLSSVLRTLETSGSGPVFAVWFRELQQEAEQQP